ncbi:hypothetical protein BIV59_07310 [Bacillus sp. MUM 13]|nr:hypothetical protein BIV59_07310 [Bacillus sp. MUM 13]
MHAENHSASKKSRKKQQSPYNLKNPLGAHIYLPNILSYEKNFFILVQLPKNISGDICAIIFLITLTFFIAENLFTER